MRAVMRLRARLIMAALLPALFAVLALGFGIATEGIANARAHARLTARLEVESFARAYRFAGPAHANLARIAHQRMVTGMLTRVELLSKGGKRLADLNLRLPPLPYREQQNIEEILGRDFIPPANLNATASLAGGVPGNVVRVTIAPQIYWREAGLAIIWAVLTALGTLLIALLLALFTSARPTRRIRQVTRYLARVARGEYGSPLQVRGRDELARLEQDANRIAATLRATRRKLDREVTTATAELNSALTELATKNTELILAGERAQAASTAKSEFLATLSHELRTPLHAIQGYANLLGKEPLSTSQHEALRVLENASNTLTRLVEDVLALAEIEAGTVRIQMRDTDIVSLIDETITLIAPMAYAKELELIADCSGWRSLCIQTDPLRLQQVLGNLLGNAIKYTTKGRISLHLKPVLRGKTSGLIEIKIRDTGPGIAADQRRLIFERRARLEQTATTEGSGLGLAISKKLVEALGGHITVEEAPGGGTEFSVRFLSRLAKISRPSAGTATCVLLYEADPIVSEALKSRLVAAGAAVETAATRSAFDTAIRSPKQFSHALLGRAQGDIPPPYSVLPMLVLRSRLEPANDAATREAPKCLSQQRLEQWLENSAITSVQPAEHLIRTPRLWRMLCEDAPIELDRLCRHIGTGDYAAAGSSVHGLRGTAAVLGMKATETAARALESGLTGIRQDACTTHNQLRDLGNALLADIKSAKPPTLGCELQGWRILIIDDNRINRELLTQTLESQAAHVCAISGSAEIESTKGNWHAALVDMHLEQEDGARLGSGLRRRHPGILLIAISADATPLTRHRAQTASFDAYLTKPVNLTCLSGFLCKLRDNSPRKDDHRVGNLSA